MISSSFLFFPKTISLGFTNYRSCITYGRKALGTCLAIHKCARGPIRVRTVLARSCVDTGRLDRKRSIRDKWWVATAVLPGQLTIAFGMFGVVVAMPNIITAFGTDV